MRLTGVLSAALCLGTLIYNGDVDACVPYTDNEAWTSGLGFAVADPWRPWTVNNQVAGYVTVYNVNQFTFLTVKGAGHSTCAPHRTTTDHADAAIADRRVCCVRCVACAVVPQYKPVQAFQMFSRFINNQPF